MSNSSNIVSVEVLAQFFEKEVRTVQLWASEFGMPKVERGQYDFLECTKWRIKYLEKEIEKLKLGDETLYKLERDGAFITNQMRKVKLMKELKKLVELDLVNIAWANEVVAFRASLNALEYSLITSLQNLHDENKKREIIKKKIRGIKEQLGGELRISESDEIDNDIIEEEPTA
jgi:hypothetical protein